MGMWSLTGTVSSKKDLEQQGNKAEKAIAWTLGELVMLKRKIKCTRGDEERI